MAVRVDESGRERPISGVELELEELQEAVIEVIVPKELVHATRSSKLPRILKEGLKVTPRTKPTTPFCEINQWDCLRDRAFECSEETLEGVRRSKRTDLPSRRFAVFFSPGETSTWLDSPREFIQTDREGDRVLNLGFGRDALVVADPLKFPPECQCATGENEASDLVFSSCTQAARLAARRAILGPHGSLEEILTEEDTLSRMAVEQAESFWRRARPYKPGGPIEIRYGREPEIWCQCKVPPTAFTKLWTPRDVERGHDMPLPFPRL